MVRVLSAAFLITVVTGGTAFYAVTRMRNEDCNRCSLRQKVRTHQSSPTCPHHESSQPDCQGSDGVEPIVLLPQVRQAPAADIETGQPPQFRVTQAPLRMPLADEKVTYVPVLDEVAAAPVDLKFSLENVVNKVLESFASEDIQPVSFEPTPLPENTQVEDAVQKVTMPLADHFHHDYPSCPYMSGHGSYPRYYPTYTAPQK